MDYKITPLQKKLEVEDRPIPEIQSLRFGTLPDQSRVFDYTAYLEDSKLDPIDCKAFMRANKRIIETLMAASGKRGSEAFYLNSDGHVLAAEELAYFFLAFANPDMCLYFQRLVGDALMDGVAFSNGFAYRIASERIPSEILEDIITGREEDERGE